MEGGTAGLLLLLVLQGRGAGAGLCYLAGNTLTCHPAGQLDTVDREQVIL